MNEYKKFVINVTNKKPIDVAILWYAIKEWATLIKWKRPKAKTLFEKLDDQLQIRPFIDHEHDQTGIQAFFDKKTQHERHRGVEKSRPHRSGQQSHPR